ncbi:hypothetical protein A6R68_00382, partial [Neotoma lepida]
HFKRHRALYNMLTTESQTDPQEEIVNAHNAYRRKVSPSGRNMLKMVIETWYNESKHFTYGEWPSSDDDFKTDHYTQ